MVFIRTLFTHGTDPGPGDTDTQIITQLVSDWPPELDSAFLVSLIPTVKHWCMKLTAL